MAAMRASPARFAAHFAIFEMELLLKNNGRPKDMVCTYVAARVLRGITPGNGIDPSFSLKALLERELGIEMQKETRDRDWREPLDAEAREYGLLDSRGTLYLWKLFKAEFDEDPDQYAGFRIVNDAIPAIATCNLNGLVFDRDAHTRLCLTRYREMEEVAMQMDLVCDGEIKNPNSARQVSEWIAKEITFDPEASVARAALVFAEVTGAHWGTTTAGKQLSLDKDDVGRILADIEIVEEWRRVSEYLRLRAQYQKHAKLLQAFGEPLVEAVDPDGHLRGSLIPHGARTSRQSRPISEPAANASGG